MTRLPNQATPPMPIWLRTLGVLTSLAPAAAFYLGLASSEDLSAVLGILVLGSLLNIVGLLLILTPVALWSAGSYPGGLACAFLLASCFPAGALLGEHLTRACLSNVVPFGLGLWLILKNRHQQET